MFNPDPAAHAELQRRCSDGGVAWAFCRWDRRFGCLMIFTLSESGEFIATFPVKNERGEPCQLDNRHIAECERSHKKFGTMDERMRYHARLQREYEERSEIETDDGMRRSYRWGKHHRTSKTFIGGMQAGGQRDSLRDSEASYCEHDRIATRCEKCCGHYVKPVYLNSGIRLNDKRRVS